MNAARFGEGRGGVWASALPLLIAACVVAVAGSASCSSDVTTTTEASSSSGGGEGGSDATSSTTTATVVGSSGFASSGALASASSAGGGGEGGASECSVPEDCPGASEECRTRTCESGLCGVSFEPAGTETSGQIAGDCRRFICDGDGTGIATDDDDDIFDDELECTLDTCERGEVTNSPRPAGTACESGDGVCDGDGACVECVGGDDCESGLCDDGECLDASCNDGSRNGDETDVDCGGSCGACADGSDCEEDDDCESLVCDDDVCASPSCGDGELNGGETDEDCGGPVCDGCGPGEGCETGEDCRGGECSGSVCLPTCSDLVTNGDETDTDCGGVDCDDCDDGDTCVGADDCVSGVCDDVCLAPTCFDLVTNGDETSLDCGGPLCDPCDDGEPCEVAGDCTSGVCNVVCQAPGCNDDVENGDETDEDCGGSCPGCFVGLACLGDADCDSQRCTSDACLPSLLFSEMRTRGSAGASDELIEIYNATSEPVTMGSSWTINVRGASGINSCTGIANVRFTGAGDVIPPHGHLLLGASPGYDDGVAVDRTYGSPFVDAANVILSDGGETVDAMCFSFDATTLARLVDPTCNYVCEGNPVSNLPHDNGTTPGGDVDVSLSRLPGGGLGNGQDTGDNAADFESATSSPQNLASPPTP